MNFRDYFQVDPDEDDADTESDIESDAERFKVGTSKLKRHVQFLKHYFRTNALLLTMKVKLTRRLKRVISSQSQTSPL